MINLATLGLANLGLMDAVGDVDMGRGAIAGAVFVAIAFLAGFAVIRRSNAAVSALVLVAAAGALQLSTLGLFGVPPASLSVLLQGLFAASVILFLSTTISAARISPLLSGVMFTAALVLAGLGVINLFDRVDIAPLMRWSLMAVGGFTLALAAVQSIRGDSAAQIILPGAVLALAAPIMTALSIGAAGPLAILPHGFFLLGVLTASLVALTEGWPVGHHPAHHMAAHDGHADFKHHDDFFEDRTHSDEEERSRIVIDSQIARVLDYAGLATWDWSADGSDHTSALPQILGADSAHAVTPEALKHLIDEKDVALFEKEVLGPEDGKFDVTVSLNDGRSIRLRGARAGNPHGDEVERVVAFVEQAQAGATFSAVSAMSKNGVTETGVRKATEAASVPTAAALAAGAKLSKALDNGDIVAAFQPIVSLKDEKVAGYEALARWQDQEDGSDEGPASFVKTAEAAGKGGELAEVMLNAAGAFLAEKIKKDKRSNLFVTLNVSFGQMCNEGFVDAVRDTIDKHSLPEKALVLELTEADAVSDRSAAGSIFRRLQNAGAALAFDDFGAGFSCLSNLHKYDFEYIKIDKSFVDGLEKDGDAAKIVRSLAGLGKDLGMKVIAEGVETKAAAQAARNIGCAYAQGFVFGKPVETSTKTMSASKRRDKAQDKVREKVQEKLLQASEDSVEPQAQMPERKSSRWLRMRRDLR